MKLWKWVKNHPAEAMALAMGTALTGGAAAGVIGGGAAAAGAAEAGVAGASLAAGEEAAAIAAAQAAAAGGGEAVSGAAAGHLAGSGVGVPAAAAADSALLAAYPAAEADVMATMAAGAGDSALLSPFPAPSSVAGAGAESSLYGPNVATDPSKALDARAWYERFGDKLKDPKTVMRLGMMGAQMGAPRPQGGPQGFAYEQPGYRSAMHSQEDITKAWLMRNDPNTYRRIYGNPPQGAA